MARKLYWMPLWTLPNKAGYTCVGTPLIYKGDSRGLFILISVDLESVPS